MDRQKFILPEIYPFFFLTVDLCVKCMAWPAQVVPGFKTFCGEGSILSSEGLFSNLRMPVKRDSPEVWRDRFHDYLHLNYYLSNIVYFCLINHRVLKTRFY